MGRLTPKLQNLIVHTAKIGKLSYKTQNIYNSHRFYNAIAFLKRNNLIMSICPVCFKELNENEIICGNKDKSHRIFKSENTNPKMFKLNLKGEIYAYMLSELR